MFCTQCGKKLEDGCKFCSECGAPINKSNYEDLSFNTEIKQDVSLPLNNVQTDDKPKKKKFGKKVIAISLIIAVLIASGIFIYFNSGARLKYKEATRAMNQGNYYLASIKFSDILDYKDSEELYDFCYKEFRYADAKEDLEFDDFGYLSAAKNILEELKGYKDTEELLEFCNKKIEYVNANEMLLKGEYEEARNIYISLGDFLDSKDKITACDNFKEYMNAVELYNNEEYEEAAEIFEKLSGIEDSDDYFINCNNAIKYKEAMELFESKKYDEAAVIFKEITGYEDATIKLNTCEYMPKYDEATKLMNDGKYDEAAKLFSECADHDVLDSKDLSEKCKNAKTLEADYNEAMKLYNAGKYYSAMKKFEALGNFKDSSKKKESCVRPRPSSGVMNRNSNYNSSAVYLSISAPSGKDVYLKIKDGSTVAATVFIRAGGSASVNLPSGTYTIDADYGDTWYGTIESFGPNGSYCTLLNGSSTSFSLSSGSWSLQLLASTNGNVGSRGRSWGS